MIARAAFTRREQAVERAKALQETAQPGELFSVERDEYKGPYYYRVICWNLYSASDRDVLVPRGRERVDSVFVIFYARRLMLVKGRPRLEANTGDERLAAKLAERRRRLAA